MFEQFIPSVEDRYWELRQICRELLEVAEQDGLTRTAEQVEAIRFILSELDRLDPEDFENE